VNLPGEVPLSQEGGKSAEIIVPVFGSLTTSCLISSLPASWCGVDLWRVFVEAALSWPSAHHLFRDLLKSYPERKKRSD
jgi:hypothetical protein